MPSKDALSVECHGLGCTVDQKRQILFKNSLKINMVEMVYLIIYKKAQNLKKNILVYISHYTAVLYRFQIQLPTFAYTRLLNKPYENEVTLTGQNTPLKCY